MKPVFSRHHPSRLRQAAQIAIQASALALLLMLALPARADDERAVKSQVPVIYPVLAKRMRVQGVVHVEATVDATGKVVAATTIGGSRILAPSAEDSVRKWRFEPGTGTAKVTVDVTFVLDK